ncbi:MAG TPA: amidohydrolase family protein [Chloroflexota bacterium]|nr:amidohydrolase family protein [Chloroflexota bacterium]
MIVDSHCHAWRYWPYQPPVPDPESRALAEQLLFEMDTVGVEQAVVVCARIAHNPENNEYVAECVGRFPARLRQLADVDCSWSETYHAPGAANRLREAADRYPLVGFTHYVKADDDGSWYLSEEGLAFFRVAEERRLIASLSIPARLHPVLRQVAERFPSVPFLVHHMGGARAAEEAPYPLFKEVLDSARVPNIFVKLSGFHHASTPELKWEYPYPHCQRLVRGLYEHFGPDRLCWGSDYPVVRAAMTYRQSLEAVRTHCREIIPEAEMGKVLGKNMERMLARGE